MTLLDLILNLAGLLVWLSWRSVKFDPLVRASPFSLAGALKRTEPAHFRRWYFLAALGALLSARALLYWQLGSAVNWVPHLRLGAISLFFRSDLPGRAGLFSALSFGLTVAVFYLWLLLLSLVNRRTADEEPVQRLVRLHLGRIDGWPWPVKLALPLFVTTLLWLALNPVLTGLKLIQPALSIAHRFEEAAIIGLSSYLAWQYLIGGLLLLSLFSTYVYLGSNPWWNFVTLTGANLLVPLHRAPLRLGKVDLAPVVGIAAVFIAGNLAERGLTMLYSRLTP